MKKTHYPPKGFAAEVLEYYKRNTARDTAAKFGKKESYVYTLANYYGIRKMPASQINSPCQTELPEGIRIEQSLKITLPTKVFTSIQQLRDYISELDSIVSGYRG